VKFQVCYCATAKIIFCQKAQIIYKTSKYTPKYTVRAPNKATSSSIADICGLEINSNNKTHPDWNSRPSTICPHSSRLDPVSHRIYYCRPSALGLAAHNETKQREYIINKCFLYSIVIHKLAKQCLEFGFRAKSISQICDRFAIKIPEVLEFWENYNKLL